jgi:hypothetical protein
VVDLFGTSMSALVYVVPAVVSRTDRDVVLIGGLAVVCRLARPYRTTSDVDFVSRRSEHEPAQLTLLLASGAEASGVSGALVPTSAGDVQVDVLDVTDAELASLPDDPTDRSPEVRGRPFWSHNVPSVNAEAPDRVQSAAPMLPAADSPTEVQVR